MVTEHTHTHTQHTGGVDSSEAAVLLTSKCEFLLLFCCWEAGLTAGGWRVEGGSKGALPLTTAPSQSCESEREAEETVASQHVGGRRGDATSQRRILSSFTASFCFDVSERFSATRLGG